MSGYWTPEPIFGGKTVFILGGGPSLDQALANRLCGRSVIVVNTAAELAPWAHVLFFRDADWMRRNRDLIERWQGIAVGSCHSRDPAPLNVKFVSLQRRPDFPPPGFGGPTIRHGRSSGHAAVSLAIAMSAARIVLVGFDCRLVDGRSHFHDRYSNPEHLYLGQFLPAWTGWNSAAQRVGVEILNATPGSAITEFPTVTIGKILGGSA